MSMQTLAVILGLLLLGAIIWIFSLRKERDKYLIQYKPTKEERDRLQEKVASLSKKLETSDKEPVERVALKEDGAIAEKKEKPEKAKKAASEESAKLKEVKEENYRLKQDNKELRKNLKERDSADSGIQKDLIAARESSSELQKELDSAQTRLRLLERDLETRKADEIKPKVEELEMDPSSETEERLRKDIDRINEKWRATREELDGYKRNFRAEIEAAKQEYAEANKAVRKDLGHARRLAAQSKKRADNNHRIFLIARSQLLLAEQQLLAMDPSYKPVLTLATSDSGIEDKLNKFITQSARHDKAVEEAQKSAARVAELEALLGERGVQAPEAAPDELKADLEALRFDSKEMAALDSGWDLDGL